MRQENHETLEALRSKTSSKKLWEGTWVSLKNAANMAKFGDHRTYYYKGKEIDEQVHLGVDLASLANSPVPAANNGRVIFADGLGIYGLTVVLDHGQGLASLYECSTTRNGSIWGLTNWRITGLRQEIRKKTLPSFKVLMAMDEDTFCGETTGDNYAQSRYLLQYLQEKGLLKEYYHAFLAARESDPTGYETLKSILGEDDMTQFKVKWQKWVMRLKYER